MGRFCTGRPQQVSVTMQAVSVRFCVSILYHFSGSQRGWFCSAGGVWPRLETFSSSQFGGGELLASRRHGTRMLLNAPQCTGPPLARTIRPETAAALDRDPPSVSVRAARTSSHSASSFPDFCLSQALGGPSSNTCLASLPPRLRRSSPLPHCCEND